MSSNQLKHQKSVPYSDLFFTKEQLLLSNAEAVDVAEYFWNTKGLAPENLTDVDRAFIQRALLIAVDLSEKAGFLFDIFSAFTQASVRQSVKVLVRALAKRSAKRWFKKYIGETPGISPIGKSGLQYSYGFMKTEWKLRWINNDPNELTNYLVE